MRNDMKHGHKLAGCQAEDPVVARLRARIDQLWAEKRRMQRDIGAIYDAWNGLDHGCQQPIHDEHGIHEGFGGLIVVAAMGSGAWDCEHDHMDGDEYRVMGQPRKVWRCASCGTERPYDAA